MSLSVHWLSEARPQGGPCFVAFPGVGDIGLLALSMLEASMPSSTIAEVLDSTLPPLATLDSNGVLRPPRHRLVRVEREAGPLHLFVGAGQANTPADQHRTALDLVDLFHDLDEVVGLAGFKSGAMDRRAFFVATSKESLSSMEASGRQVNKTEPSAGCIGVLALLVSLGPYHGLDTSLAIATTLGASQDRFAAQRLLGMLDEAFAFGMSNVNDVERELRERLSGQAPETVENHVAELLEGPDAFYA
jgi:proteasome assembly chaperone (PAC2) family protein